MYISTELAKKFVEDLEDIGRTFLFEKADDFTLRLMSDKANTVSLDYQARYPEFDFYKPYVMVEYYGRENRAAFSFTPEDFRHKMIEALSR